MEVASGKMQFNRHTDRQQMPKVSQAINPQVNNNSNQKQQR
jgi:hypothetical protein